MSMVGQVRAVDVGGTFTDLAFIDISGELHTSKVSTTPDDFSKGVVRILRPGRKSRAFERSVFASTIFINALVTGSGAQTALVTTRGFRDVLELGRGNRPDMYNLAYQKGRPQIPRRLRFEVGGRIDATGAELAPLDEAAVERVAADLIDLEVEAVAIAFINSYCNPDHELRCQDLLKSVLPPDVPVVTSSDVSRLWMEYERTSSTVVNARLAPLAQQTFRQVENLLHDDSRHVSYAMRSNGGVTDFRTAISQPVHLLESGPAGGVIGCQALGRRHSEPNLITFDVGGTTAKCSLIRNGALTYTLDYILRASGREAGYPIRTPTIDIVEIGSGGGSLVTATSGGRLTVGPESAGAFPGPACYGAGGEDFTVTDACLLAGYVGVDRLGGGEFEASINTAEDAMQRVRQSFGTSREEFLSGVLKLAQTRMSTAVRLVTIERGHDPRDFVLVAFGGGGPLHAWAVAEELGIPRILIPTDASVFSAVGMLHAGLRDDGVVTSVLSLDTVDEGSVLSVLQELKEKTAARLIGLGAGAEYLRYDVTIDARFSGQEHTVAVPLPSVHSFSPENFGARFSHLHRQQYGFSMDDPIELVHFRVSAYEQNVVAQNYRYANVAPPAGTRQVTRSVLFEGQWTEVPVLERSALVPGIQLDGPLLIDEPTTTTVTGPRQCVEVLNDGTLQIATIGESA